MAGEIIRLGDKTSHHGTVLEGSPADICHGKPIAYIGHKVSCPKCSGSHTIVEGVMTTSIYGKGVAVAGMKTSCGAVLIASQFTDIVEYAGGGGGGGGASEAAAAAAPAVAAAAVVAAGAAAKAAGAEAPEDKPAAEKKIKRLYWSYGDDETPVSGKSRHHVDLNLHVETENYAAGDKVDITLANDDGDDVITDQQLLKVQATVQADGTAKIAKVFGGKTVDITRSVT
ncbi:PAAR domain-containing protein [Duganella aceris]|uniref:PAAR domain-containing protein n=1 Tax=Duganella aceris TaxID=2703883 RepID=UPI001E4E71FE|nr:PAAR domain-containing protein [Duganella aceris]